MDKNGIRNLLERMLKSHPDDITDNNDRKVWISDVAEAFYKIANTDLNNPDELKPGGRYLCTSIKVSEHSWKQGMTELQCLEVTEKAYKVKVDGDVLWLQKTWSIDILEVLNEPTIDPKFFATATTVTFNEQVEEVKHKREIPSGHSLLE
jgi:hypothetical protein